MGVYTEFPTESGHFNVGCQGRCEQSIKPTNKNSDFSMDAQVPVYSLNNINLIQITSRLFFVFFIISLFSSLPVVARRLEELD